jgi:uncharacterized LabA/DUF88 family protein
VTESGWIVDRCVVLVDAGYLLGAAASLLAGEPMRSQISVDHAALIRGLRERAEADTGCDLLRIYWFDGAPDRVPQPEHRRLRVMPRVTVRLGALTRSDGRWAQKGVDAAMHAELTELARNRACSDIVLVTGDGDLLPGLMSAKEHGVAVHLWAVQAADGDYNQSEDLVAEADERRVLDRSWITEAVRATEPSGAYHPQSASRPEIAAILSAPLPEATKNGSAPVPPAAPGAVPPASGTADGTPAAAPAEDDEGDSPAAASRSTPGVPTPKDLASLGRPAPPPHQGQHTPPGATLRWSSERGWVERGTPGESAEVSALPMLAQLTTAEQRWADREEDITAVSGDPFEVGQVFARRWLERLGSPAHVQTLAREYPRIPHRIDGELLRYAARFGLLAHKDDQIDEHDRYAIRAGFWREVDAPVAGQATPNGQGGQSGQGGEPGRTGQSAPEGHAGQGAATGEDAPVAEQ